MVTVALPRESTRGRDMAGWAACQNFGQALGGFFGGIVLNAVGNAGETVGEGKGLEGDDDGLERKMYSRDGYVAIFAPAAAIMILSAVVLWPMRNKLAGLKAQKEEASRSLLREDALLLEDAFLEETDKRGVEPRELKGP